MKDLKHYFTENVKGCEASNGETREVMKESVNAEASVEDVKEIPNATAKRKRGRVKIKISQTNIDGRVCDIVESKDDSIDKTPSPFTGCRHDVETDETSQSHTPKRSNSLPQKSGKNVLVKAATRRRASVQTESKEKNSGDENDNLISNLEKKSRESIAGLNGRNILVENAAATCADVTTVEREESNAFQVLMTRKKPVQYVVPALPSPEDEELDVKMVRESKMKMKQNREKLVVLADKKGYTKRKLGEMEEAEKIERRLEKRAKVFKINGKKEEEDESSPSLGRRVVPGSLHNYFSKATPEQKEKELTAVSTLVVKADVHVPDYVTVAKARETAEAKRGAKVAKVETREVMATINDIQVVGSENLGSQYVNEETKSNESRKKKPRWSLRINLQCKDKDEQADPVVQNDEKILPGRRESKPRKSKVKSANYEENDNSQCAASNVEITKKRKSVPTIQNTKIPLSKADIEPSDLQDESLPIIVDIAQSNKTEPLQIEEPEIIVIKEVKRQTSERLAPLFVKKQKPDPAVLEARRLFLHSVPAEDGNQRTERKVPVVRVPLLPFPTISHVAQLSGESKIEPSPLISKFPMRSKCTFAPSYNLNEFKSVTGLKNESENNSEDRVQMTKGNVEEVLSEIESRCSDAREIWTRISTTMNIGERRKTPKRKSKKRKSSEKKVENVLLEEEIGHDGIWTHKYRPMSGREIVGNEEAARKLFSWLESWKAPLRKEDNSSGDEFYSSDCSYASDKNQVAVLLGPHGSGKTASVYAIAQELGYSVLEVNASSKRAGKKLLKELEEATKSHRIKQSEGISILPIPKEKKAIPQNSLILVEDVDLIFEEDEGFVTATCQLASNTKRPIIMTGRDTCSHLNRMAPQQLRIYYQTTVGSRVSALLELITLAESGYRLPRPCLDRLLQNGDLRKALLQLQYLLLSGQPSASEVPTNFHRTLWQDMRYCLYKPAIKATKKSSKKKLANTEKSSSPLHDKFVVTSLANDLDSWSFISTLIEIDDPALDVTSLKLEPSMSLAENTHTYSSISNTSAEIATWLRNRLLDGKRANDPGESHSQIVRQQSLKKELNAGVNLALSQVSPQTLDGRVMTLDYVPSLRAICRAEDLRVSSNNKRGNRFFHYLQNLRLPSTSTRPNILAAACKMMRDKNTES